MMTTMTAAMRAGNHVHASRRRALAIGHRGSPGPGRPENTVAAVTAALDEGADGVEIDVRLTADGSLVCSHDASVTGVFGHPVYVGVSTAAELRLVRLPGGHTLGQLPEVLTAARCRRRCHVVVEAKPCTDTATVRRTALALADELACFACDLDLTVSSFDAPLLAEIRVRLDRLPVRTALLGHAFIPASQLLTQAMTEAHDEIQPHLFSLLKAPAVVQTAHALGLGVTCWTVNRRRHVTALSRLGVDGIITDNVSGVRAMLSTV